jgi:hypothetical protein
VAFSLLAAPALACPQAEYDQKIRRIEANAEKVKRIVGDPDDHRVKSLEGALQYAREEVRAKIKPSGDRTDACEFLDSMIGATTPAE